MRLPNFTRPFARCAAGLVGFVVLAGASAPLGAASKIEAVAGKKYVLDRRHGPWMIMAATFHDYNTKAEGEQVGKPPEEAAADLVFELRQRGIPAYTYITEGDEGTVATIDRLGREDVRKNRRRIRSYGVLAGNYAALDNELAQRTLAYIKALKPKCLNPESGVVWFAPAGEGPLRNAFLTPNPLLTAAELESRRPVDPLLVRLNSDENFSLLENKGAYTLQVAMFTGRRALEGSSGAKSLLKEDDPDKLNPLAAAAYEAHLLATALREHRQIEAYVWHDHYSSIVTVGSFDSPDNAEARALIEKFKAKPTLVGDSGEMQIQPEVFWMPGYGDDGSETRMWAFMPSPVSMPVPRIHGSQVAGANNARRTSPVRQASGTR